MRKPRTTRGVSRQEKIIIIIIIIIFVSAPWNVIFLEKLIVFQFPALSFTEHKFICHRPMSQDQTLIGMNRIHIVLRNN
jgi:hypothetical protein